MVMEVDRVVVVRTLLYAMLVIGLLGAIVSIGTSAGEWFAAIALSGAVVILVLQHGIFTKTKRWIRTKVEDEGKE